MAENTHIEWATHTWNPWMGCTKVSTGCASCYAEVLTKGRMQLKVWGPTASRQPRVKSAWREPIRWNAKAKAAGERHRVFCASLADVFEGPETCQESGAYQVVMEGRQLLWDLICATPNLDWLLLTKRPENILRFTPQTWEHGGCPSNIWLGTSVENQNVADKRVPELIKAGQKLSASVLFLSCEPLLGPVDIRRFLTHWECHCGAIAMPLTDATECACGDIYEENWTRKPGGIHWVIAGGESGPNARPMHPDWARSLCNQCVDAGIAFHFKQNGEYRPYKATDHLFCKSANQYAVGPTGHIVTHRLAVQNSHKYGTEAGYAMLTKAGKKKAGRLLDGRTWDELPEVEP